MNGRCFLGLLHYPTVDREGREGATAVTTLDLHDLARLACTYGLGGVFVVTPLEAQRELVGRLLRHWIDGHGGRVNPDRRQALLGIRVVAQLEGAVSQLQAEFSRVPLLLATSARSASDRLSVTDARRRIDAVEQPVLLLFGTGWGLAPQVHEMCDATLEPVCGPVEYNHLSVRSAASIVVDRLFGSRDIAYNTAPAGN